MPEKTFYRNQVLKKHGQDNRPMVLTIETCQSLLKIVCDLKCKEYKVNIWDRCKVNGLCAY